MQDKIGEEYDGVITAVTNFGVFVQLPELQIDGLVHVTSLQNDYYHYQPESQQLVGERTGRVYGLGESMRVKVQRVDMDTRKIDFMPVEDAAAHAAVRPSSRTRGRRR